MENKPIEFIYFGGEPIGVPVLEELKVAGLLPSLIVCNPDRPVGRKQLVTPPPVKVWAAEHDIPVYQPEKIPKEKADLGPITDRPWELFVVVAYNFILPQWFIDLPEKGTLNVHPSLLPKLRGASPIRTTILENMREECGVSVMQLDAKMDHGPVVAQKKMEIANENWPIAGPELDVALAHLGGALLADTLPKWAAGEITPTEQAHDEATYCGRITKDIAELTIDPYNLPTGAAAYEAFLKIQAYAGWPIAFFKHHGKRFKITKACLENDVLQIEKIIPEGKSETDFQTYFRED